MLRREVVVLDRRKFIHSLMGLGVALSMWSPAVAQEEAKKKVAVCSTTQVADFVRQVVGDTWEVKCVLGAAQDPHTYETTSDDLAAVKAADICFENGWHLEGHDWMQKLGGNAGKTVVTCVNGIKPLEFDEDGTIVNDPHAWFSPKNATIYVNNIVKGLSQLDPENADEYELRADLFKIQLKALDHWTSLQVNAIPKDRRVLATHHDAFGYFCQAYGFKAVSPMGWNTEELTSVSIQQKQEVVEKLRTMGVRSMFVESSVNPELIQGIAKEAGVKLGGTLYADAMGEEGSAGETYIGMMRENVIKIVTGLKPDEEVQK